MADSGGQSVATSLPGVRPGPSPFQSRTASVANSVDSLHYFFFLINIKSRVYLSVSDITLTFTSHRRREPAEVGRPFTVGCREAAPSSPIRPGDAPSKNRSLPATIGRHRRFTIGNRFRVLSRFLYGISVRFFNRAP